MCVFLPTKVWLTNMRMSQTNIKLLLLSKTRTSHKKVSPAKSRHAAHWILCLGTCAWANKRWEISLGSTCWQHGTRSIRKERSASCPRSCWFLGPGIFILWFVDILRYRLICAYPIPWPNTGGPPWPPGGFSSTADHPKWWTKHPHTHTHTHGDMGILSAVSSPLRLWPTGCGKSTLSSAVSSHA